MRDQRKVFEALCKKDETLRNLRSSVNNETPIEYIQNLSYPLWIREILIKARESNIVRERLLISEEFHNITNQEIIINDEEVDVFQFNLFELYVKQTPGLTIRIDEGDFIVCGKDFVKWNNIIIHLDESQLRQIIQLSSPLGKMLYTVAKERYQEFLNKKYGLSRTEESTGFKYASNISGVRIQ